MAGENTMSLDDVFIFKRRFRRRKDDKELNPFREAVTLGAITRRGLRRL